MRKQLTQAVVDRMRAPAERTEISDHLLPALRLIVQPSGARSWAVRTRVHGKPCKLTVGNAQVIGITEAREKARELLREVAAGKDPRQAKREKAADTLGAVADQYLRHVVATRRPRTQEECRRHLNQHWRPLHHRPLAELTRREIAARLLELKDDHGPVAANRARSVLSAMFTWAIGQGLVEVNPVTGTSKNAERSRERVLSIEELRAIWRATDGPGAYDAIIRLAALLGARKGEIGAMMWGEVDLDRALWSIPGSKTKNGQAHQVPLSEQALEIIKAQPRHGEYVFGARGDAPFSGWSRCKRRLDKRCGIAEWDVHDLRRSFVTHLCEIGVAPHVVESAVNHVSGHRAGVAGVYNKSTYWPERVRALQQWADHLLGAGEAKVIDLNRARGTA
jgi:integrase